MNRTILLKSSQVLISFTICILGGWFFACNQPFDPRGELDRRTVLFSVFSTDRTFQYVRAERSYMPKGFDPLSETSDAFVPNAVVTIADGGVEARFRDTSLVRSDTSRYRFPIRAYVLSPFTPAYGVTYTLKVEGQQLEPATASVSVPAKPVLGIAPESYAVMDRPSDHDSSAAILFPVMLGNGAAGYIGRLFVDYQLLQGGVWVEGRLEVPLGFTYSGFRSYNYVEYPALTRRPSVSRAAGFFQNQFYRHAIALVAYEDFGTRRVKFNRVVFQVLQVEQNLYNYYRVAHMYKDPHSLRLDEPMYSSIDGGVGMVGAYTLDSLVHLLPEDFIYNRQ